MRTATVALVATLCLLAGCGSPDAADPEVVERHVATRSAGDVVRDYLAAVQDGDRTTAAALSTEGFAQRDTWQRGDAPGLSDVEVSDVVAPYPIPDEQDVAEDLRGYAQFVSVPVTFTVEDDDRGFSTDGPSGWAYVLVRESDDDPWLIAEAGNG